MSFWPALEEGAHLKEVKQEVDGDAAEKKHEGSGEALFSSTPTQHLCTSTTAAQSCFSEGTFATIPCTAHRHRA